MLIKFNQHFGLRYGIFDFIMNEKNQLIFLECNPDGNWKWLDDKIGGHISDAFADLLGETTIKEKTECCT